MLRLIKEDHTLRKNPSILQSVNPKWFQNKGAWHIFLLSGRSPPIVQEEIFKVLNDVSEVLNCRLPREC